MEVLHDVLVKGISVKPASGGGNGNTNVSQVTLVIAGPPSPDLVRLVGGMVTVTLESPQFAVLPE